jgi:acetyl-CoA carboxylase biotin carboxyl carrier protein
MARRGTFQIRKEEPASVTIEEIRQLVQLVQESAIAELDITRGDESIRIIREHPQEVVVGAGAAAPATVTIPAQQTGDSTPAPAAAEVEEDSSLHTIVSPMVGTFYRAASPDAPPYVSVGDHVTKGQVVCIVEAMKLMNEISADMTGTIEKLEVENAQAVEFGQVIFRIRPG